MTGDPGTGTTTTVTGEERVLSRRRAELASFEHAYAVALRVRHQTGRCQFILRTGNAMQPVRTSCLPPNATEILLAIIA